MTTGRNQRLAFIDALRGIACVAVLLHHLDYPTLDPQLRQMLPRAVLTVAGLGAGGVEIFFVISGFVIAYSLRDFVPSVPSCTRFVVRRQVRLDPTYWCVLIPTFVLTYLGRHLAHSENGVPGVGTLAANLFYLQNVLGTPQVLGVAWTLCLEVQFYLAFLVLICLSAPLAKLTGTTLIAATAWPVLLLAVASFAINHSVLDPVFVGCWFYFAAGVLCYATLRGSFPTACFVAFCLLFAWHAYRRWPDATATFGVAATVLFFAIGRAGRLATWGGGPVLQYLGAVSYSVYLVHLPVITWTYRLAHARFPGNGAAVLTLLGTAAASLALGHLLHACVERPTQRWASSLHRRRVTTDHSSVRLTAPVPAEASVAG